MTPPSRKLAREAGGKGGRGSWEQKRMPAGEVGVGLDIFDRRWAVCPSISSYRPGILLGIGNLAMSEADRLPAFMELIL